MLQENLAALLANTAVLQPNADANVADTAVLLEKVEALDAYITLAGSTTVL